MVDTTLFGRPGSLHQNRLNPQTSYVDNSGANRFARRWQLSES